MEGKLPQYFKTHRMRHGLRQKQMGKLIGKDHCYISRIENGKTKPTLEIVLAYHILFDIEIAELVPEFHQSVCALLTKCIEEHSYLVQNKASLLLVKERLNIIEVSDTSNKMDYDE